MSTISVETSVGCDVTMVVTMGRIVRLGCGRHERMYWAIISWKKRVLVLL